MGGRARDDPGRRNSSAPSRCSTSLAQVATERGYRPLLFRIQRSYREAGFKRPQGRMSRGHVTDRERETLTLVGEGLTTKQIGERMGVMPSTVETLVLERDEEARVLDTRRSRFSHRHRGTRWRRAIIGREDELRRVIELLRARETVILVGPPGIGKSALLASVIEQLGAKSLAGAAIRALADVPYIPFKRALKTGHARGRSCHRSAGVGRRQVIASLFSRISTGPTRAPSKPCRASQTTPGCWAPSERTIVARIRFRMRSKGTRTSSS